MTEPRPLYWSIRRELWENRSITVVPVIIAGVVLFATFVSTLAARARGASLVRPFHMAPAPIMLATFIAGVFYCIDALYGDRRDRSILFWKSMPVSDRTTVLSKAAIPFAVLPSIAWILSVLVQIPLAVVVAATSVGHAGPGVGELRFFEGLFIMAYGLAVHTLWFAPIYAWLLLVGAWAKRAPILWALLPLLAISALERMALGTMAFMKMMEYRVMGAMTEAFAFVPKSGGNFSRVSQLTPAKFFAAPGFWVGLIFAALCLAAAVRLRRNREPI